MTWAWECEPETLADGVPEEFQKALGHAADELVRAAAALCLDGTTSQGDHPRVTEMIISRGFFRYLIVPRQERVYILQITCFPEG